MAKYSDNGFGVTVSDNGDGLLHATKKPADMVHLKMATDFPAQNQV